MMQKSVSSLIGVVLYLMIRRCRDDVSDVGGGRHAAHEVHSQRSHISAVATWRCKFHKSHLNSTAPKS